MTIRWAATTTRRFINLLVAFVLVAPAFVAYGGELEDLDRGKTFVQLVDVPGSRFKQGVLRGVLEAAPEEVWEVLTDYGNYKEFMPRTVESELKGRTKDRAHYATKLNMPWPISDVAYEAQVQESPNRRSFSFQLIPGTGEGVKNFEGNWTLESFQGDPNRTYVEYKILLEPSRNYPRWVVNWGTKRTLGKMIKLIRKRLKSIATTDAP